MFFTRYPWKPEEISKHGTPPACRDFDTPKKNFLQIKDMEKCPNIVKATQMYN